MDNRLTPEQQKDLDEEKNLKLYLKKLGKISSHKYLSKSTIAKLKKIKAYKKQKLEELMKKMATENYANGITNKFAVNNAYK